MHLRARDLTRAADGIEAVAFRQEVRERSALGAEARAGRRVASFEDRVIRVPAAAILDRGAIRLHANGRSEVRQAEERAGGPDRQRIRCVEAEEVHAGSAADRHVVSDIDFRKRRQPRRRRQPPRRHVGHIERDDPDPRAAVEPIERQLRRDAGAQRIEIHGPVREQQVVPGLCHDPRAPRQGPRPMAGLAEAMRVEIARLPDHRAIAKNLLESRSRRSYGTAFPRTLHGYGGEPVSTHRRNVLKRGMTLIGTAAAVAAAGKTGYAAGHEAPEAPKPGARLILHGRRWRVTSRDLKRGELPGEGVRMLTRGEIVDAPSKGRKIGEFFATYHRLSTPGKVGANEPGSLEQHTFVFADGTIVGS